MDVVSMVFLKEIKIKEILDKLGNKVSTDDNKKAEKRVNHLLMGGLDFFLVAKTGHVAVTRENQAKEKINSRSRDGIHQDSSGKPGKNVGILTCGEDGGWGVDIDICKLHGLKAETSQAQDIHTQEIEDDDGK